MQKFKWTVSVVKYGHDASHSNTICVWGDVWTPCVGLFPLCVGSRESNSTSMMVHVGDLIHHDYTRWKCLMICFHKFLQVGWSAHWWVWLPQNIHWRVYCTVYYHPGWCSDQTDGQTLWLHQQVSCPDISRKCAHSLRRYISTTVASGYLLLFTLCTINELNHSYGYIQNP